jgi:4-amino-4-deoxy-L-arabinose transferase-like glycosyltransferase
MTRRGELAAYAVIVVLTMIRIASTWRVFSQTTDEPMHFYSGYQWLAEKKYDLNREHPPLARVVEALPLYLAGARDPGEGSVGDRINTMFMFRGKYEHNMLLIRCGNLLFVILAIVAVALWARTVMPPPFAILTTAMFASLPPVLAHGGLATTDMAGCATYALAIVALYYWLQKPSPLRAIILGIACGLGVVSKFSFIPFFGATAVAVIAIWWIQKRELQVRHATTLIISGAVTIAIIALAYRGDLSAFIDGIRILQGHALRGHPAYLFGRRSDSGWWYYFPVALLFKTPLPFLALAAMSVGQTLLSVLLSVLPSVRGSKPTDKRTDKSVCPPLMACVIMAIAMATPINIGVRHILPIYVPLAILAGSGAQELWQRGRNARIAVAALCVWMFIGTSISHPDYIPWFNELALGHGERILSDSNFDWGQDVLRLRNICRQRHIDHLAIEVFTGAPLDQLGFPIRRKIWPPLPTTGWHAISETYFTAAGGDAGYAYVTQHPVICRAGKTIRLYYVK